MLIQRISPFVPLHHIKRGTFGLRGHVCAFEQDLNEFLQRLPRTRDDTSLLKVVQSIKAEIGNGDASTSKCFRVRKLKVKTALQWLKTNNPLYSDIIISMDALDWIDGEEGYLEGHEIHTEKMNTKADHNAKNADLGPAIAQTMDPMGQGDNIEAFGYIDEGGKAGLSDEDREINNELREAVGNMKNQSDIVVDWPAVKDQAISEYGNTKIFCLAFPWLFPGGIGDVKDFPGNNIKDWGQMMLYYEDGRFAKDKIFCFYAMNYIIRQRNSTSGSFFVNTFQSNCPDTLDELKEDIGKGNSTFVNSLTYYNKRITGSTAYWGQKRAEVYSWMNHHVERGNGVPTFFITLSCAEYFWPDIIDLIQERMKMAGDKNWEECVVGSPKLSQMINDYSIVIQEYFQHRVQLWLKTVGKQIFGIKHYWCRYEFAPGRGQIHAHLLAISDDQDIYSDCHDILKGSNGVQERAAHLETWAQKKFGLTASVSDDFESRQVTPENTPVRIRFTDVPNTEEAINDDIQNLMKFCMIHGCSEFCMRKSKGEK